MKKYSDKKIINKTKKNLKPEKKISKNTLVIQDQIESHVCIGCLNKLKTNQKVLFVEEEKGRIFCSEKCIVQFFSAEIKSLEKEYFNQISKENWSDYDRARLSALRWNTLREPSEVWRRASSSGDSRYTLISEFKYEGKKAWYICICLLLKGKPSFLFLAFPTMSRSVLKFYQSGELIQLKARTQQPKDVSALVGRSPSRRKDDIPLKEFRTYQIFFDETLNNPDEVWLSGFDHDSMGQNRQIFHFIRRYQEGKKGFWYIVVAKETDDQEQIEIVDSAPTRDLGLVEQYRVGDQKIGHSANEEEISQALH